MSVLRLGTLLHDRRGKRGIREIATEIGVSAATLSRVERGLLPDILTFSKLCSWLQIDPSSVLDVPKETPVNAPSPVAPVAPSASVHFRADATLDPSAASDLAQLILAAHHEMSRRGL